MRHIRKNYFVALGFFCFSLAIVLSFQNCASQSGDSPNSISAASMATPPAGGSVTELDAAGFSFFYDSTVGGRKVYSLSEMPGDNYALYYHVNSYSLMNGQPLLVIRNTVNNSASSLFYYTVNLLTGKTNVITPQGQTNGGTVQGNFLYAFFKPSLAAPFDRISRFNLQTAEREDLCQVNPAWSIGDNVVVNKDESKLLFLQLSSAYRQLWVCDILQKQTETKYTINTTDQIEHFVFSPTNSNIYFYINQSKIRLARIGIGSLVPRMNGSLQSTNASLSMAQNFPHPFFDSQGTYWSDLITQDGAIVDLVRFQLSGDPLTLVKNYLLIDTGASLWQQHYNHGAVPLEFVGDGSGAGMSSTYGVPFINKLIIDPTTLTARQIPLASNFGNGTETDGNLQTNTKYIPYGSSGGIVIWSPFRTVTDAQTTGPRQVLATSYQ